MQRPDASPHHGSLRGQLLAFLVIVAALVVGQSVINLAFSHAALEHVEDLTTETVPGLAALGKVESAFTHVRAVALSAAVGGAGRRRVEPRRPSLDAGLASRIPLRVLVVEDNVVNQRVAIRILDRLGYRADVAANGIEAVEALERRTYDFVFMDVMMPEMDGLEATKRIRQRWPGSQAPWIVAMTANAMAGDREECVAAGMDDYVSKPVRPEELQAAIERFVIRTRPAAA